MVASEKVELETQNIRDSPKVEFASLKVTFTIERTNLLLVKFSERNIFID
jgi:hypothetical protein